MDTQTPTKGAMKAPNQAEGRSDMAVQEQQKLLDSLRAEPYFRGFEPRAYPLYEVRYYKPLQYLEQIGIEKIGELVQHGMSQLEISKLIDINSRILRKWIKSNPAYEAEIEEARKFAGEGYAYEALKTLKEAPPVMELLTKARAVADHQRWMAERLDKEGFGMKVVKYTGEVGVGITYNFNIGAPVKRVIEGVAKIVDELPDPDDETLRVVSEMAAPKMAEERPSLDFTEEDDI